jgi:Fe2+ transport system protein FeoA
VDTDAEQAENRELKPLSDLAPGAKAEIVRLAEHDGDLLHWYYDAGLVPGTKVQLRDSGPDELTVRLNGDERKVGGEAAAGLFVRPS